MSNIRLLLYKRHQRGHIAAKTVYGLLKGPVGRNNRKNNIAAHDPKQVIVATLYYRT